LRSSSPWEEIKREAVTAAKVKKGTLTGTQINASTLGTVPSAQTARTADIAGALAPSESWHEVGAPGEPEFQHGWKDPPPGEEAIEPPSVAYYKDGEGIVHLRVIETIPSLSNEDGVVGSPPGATSAFLDSITFRAEG
jgi:hypothetical protein